MHSVYVSSFWGLRPQTPTDALPLDPVGELPSPDPLFCPSLSKFLATPLQTTTGASECCGRRHQVPRSGRASSTTPPPSHPRHFQHHFRRNARTRLVLEARPVFRLLTLAGKHSTAADNNPRARTALPRLKQLWTSAVQCVQGHKGHGPQNFSWPLITSPPLCTC